MDEYFIKEGVRRSLIALKAGRTDINASIQILGTPDVVTRLRLDQLYSSKFEMPRDLRYRRLEYQVIYRGCELDPDLPRRLVQDLLRGFGRLPGDLE